MTFEPRPYQKELAAAAAEQNTIVVLPTGMGKTAIAMLLIRERAGDGRAILLAPTRVLVDQHARFLREHLPCPVRVVTGEEPAESRAELWRTKVCCATPETARNDSATGALDLSEVSVAVFDEVHRAVGGYAYVDVARRLGPSTRMLGLTATLPDDMKEGDSWRDLGFTQMRERSRTDSGVADYARNIYAFYIKVRLHPAMISAAAHLQAALDRRYAPLRESKLLESSNQSLSNLVRLSKKLPHDKKYLAHPLYNAIRLHHMKNSLQAHGVVPFLKKVERTVQKTSPGIAELLADPDLGTARRIAEQLREDGVEHPKMAELLKLAGRMKGGALIFSSYRDSVTMITDALSKAGHPAVELTGKAGKAAGAQREAVAKFSSGECKFMVSTHVGEEGLDIDEASNVVFYDCVPGSIRTIQRIGRTGRTRDGNVFMLIAEKTIDEGYFWSTKKEIRKLGILEPNEVGQQRLV